MHTTMKPNPARIGLHLKRGVCLGKYRLRRRLGEGGYCEVWQALDTVEGIAVALKMPLADIHGKRDNEVLLREVRALSMLRHPNIVSVKNADIVDQQVVLATELSTGTLAACGKPMSVRRISSIIMQVLEGLAHAHRHRIVHCDVTPGNIFLFPDRRAALGDFGIALQLKGRMKTVDDYGTPGYVAPEQAYGRPTCRSDCFAVGLVLYEYITGVLPRWPFMWPLVGLQRLREKTGGAFVKFIKTSLSVDPRRRFADAGEMLGAMQAALPKNAKQTLGAVEKSEDNWRKVRRGAFFKRYGRVFPVMHKCVTCGEPIAEMMQLCPWCGSEKNRFDARSQFSHICPHCHKGVLPEWRFCPWCYGAGFEPQRPVQAKRLRYHAQCRYCGGGIMRFMRYCPWCHRKVRRPWQVKPLPEICGRCRWSVDSDFWSYCPWCKQSLKG